MQAIWLIHRSAENHSASENNDDKIREKNNKPIKKRAHSGLPKVQFPMKFVSSIPFVSSINDDGDFGADFLTKYIQ